MKTTIPVGPYHPLIEEPELFRVVVEGERVVDIDWRTSFMHRGVEKIGESKTYDQITFLVERICGICSTSHPLAFCNAVEDLAGVEIPPRAKYIRTIIAELERIHSHLLWLGLAGHYIGYHTIWMWSWKYRELVCDLFEVISGNRQSYAMMKPGGVRQDILPSMYPGIVSALDQLEPKVNMFIGAVLDDPVILARLKGVGKMTREEAMKWCTVGPVARSAGVDIDIRRDYPYAAYPLVEWKVITQMGGDVLGMAVVRLLETLESIKILRQCMAQIPDGPIVTEIPEVPVGEGIGVEEAPRGECFHYVRSNGTNCPYRLKIRAPTYANLPSFRSRFIGERVADIMIILASIDPCYCCTNRVVRIDDGRSVRMLDEKNLLEMSWQRTRELDGGAEHRLRSLLEL